MATMELTLGEYEQAFITEMIDGGRFRDRIEVIRAALRLLEDYETHQKAQRLRTLIDRGQADVLAGQVTTYDSPEALAQTIINRGKAQLKATV